MSKAKEKIVTTTDGKLSTNHAVNVIVISWQTSIMAVMLIYFKVIKHYNSNKILKSDSLHKYLLN